MSDKWVYDNVYKTYMYQGVEYSITNTEDVLNDMQSRITELEAENKKIADTVKRMANSDWRKLKDCEQVRDNLLQVIDELGEEATGLEARLERANIAYCLYVESPIDGHFSLFELYSNPFAFRSQLREMYNEVYITGRGRYRDALYIGCCDTPNGDIQSFKLVCHSVKGSSQ